MRHLALSLALLLAAAAPARARGAPAAAPRTDVARTYARLRAHRQRLMGLLDAAAARATRLKQAPPGVGRDLRLRRALQEAQALATRLTALDRRIRVARAALRARLVAALKRAGATPGAGPLRERLRALDAEARAISAPARLPLPRATGGDEADPTARADLLEDAAEKVRRQARRVAAQLGRLRRRARLVRHARAAEDSPFLEQTPRRALAATAGGGGGGSAADSASAGRGGVAPGGTLASPGAVPGAEGASKAPPGRAASPPAAPSAGRAPAGGGGGGTGSGGVALLRQADVGSAGLLRPPRAGGSPGAQVARLERLQRRLRRLAARLEVEAARLRAGARPTHHRRPATRAGRPAPRR